MTLITIVAAIAFLALVLGWAIMPGRVRSS